MELEFRATIQPIDDSAWPYRVVCGCERSDLGRTRPTELFARLPDLEERVRWFGFPDHQIREAKDEVHVGRMYTLRMNWRDEFENLWRK